MRECQFEGFGIKSYSEIETVLAVLKCYISAERLQMNGQDSICSHACNSSAKGKGQGLPEALEGTGFPDKSLPHKLEFRRDPN